MLEINFNEADMITSDILRGAFSFVCAGTRFTRLIKCGDHIDLAPGCVRESNSMFLAVEVTFFLD